MSDKPIYTYGRYEVRICDEVLDQDKMVRGYGVFNKQTGIREYCDVALHQAVHNCRFWEMLLREAESHPDDPNESLFDTGTKEKELALKNLN